MSYEAFPVDETDELYGDVYVLGGQGAVDEMVEYVKAGHSPPSAAEHAKNTIPLNGIKIHDYRIRHMGNHQGEY